MMDTLIASAVCLLVSWFLWQACQEEEKDESS